jgi:hypothetical protein
MFPRDMVCLKNISVDTLHKGDTENDDDDDDDNDNNNNNNNCSTSPMVTQELEFHVRLLWDHKYTIR